MVRLGRLATVSRFRHRGIRPGAQPAPPPPRNGAAAPVPPATDVPPGLTEHSCDGRRGRVAACDIGFGYLWPAM